MRNRLLSFICLFVSFSSAAQDKQLILRHVTVVDILNGDLWRDVSVVIAGNRIVAIDKNAPIPTTAVVINATGKYLIPGLWDMHVHLSHYGENALPLLIANGVTGVRDMGGDLHQLDLWRHEIATGSRLGPRIKRAGPFNDGPKKMDSFRAAITTMPRNEDEMRWIVDSLKERGVDFLKIHSRLPRNIFLALAKQAHKKNIPFAVHLPKDVTPEEAIAVRPRSIEHTESLLGSVIYEDDETLLQKQTEERLRKLVGEYGDHLAKKIAKYNIFYDPTLISLHRVADTGYVKMLASELLPVLRKLHLAGVSLLTGSDFAGKEAGIRPGYDLHDELVLFTEAGMTPVEALRASTFNAAQCLYLSDSLGTIATGNIADLVLLNDNPLADVRNTRKIDAVIVNGHYLSRRQLDEMLLEVEKYR